MMCQDADSAAKAYRFEVVSATLLLPVKTLQSALAIDLEKRLLETPITYRWEAKNIIAKEKKTDFLLCNTG